MRLNSLELHTDDVEGLARFYRDVIGVPIGPGDDEKSHYETFWGSFGGDDDDFLFFAIQPITQGVATHGAEIGFSVTDLDGVHERIVAAGAEVVEPPSPRPWGRAATYRDPAGNLVQLTEG